MKVYRVTVDRENGHPVIVHLILEKDAPREGLTQKLMKKFPDYISIGMYELDSPVTEEWLEA